MLRAIFFGAVLFCVDTCFAQETRFGAPAGSEVAKVVPNGTTILPNGRFLTPIGRRLYTGEDLWNVVTSPNGKLIIGLSDPGIVVHPSDAASAHSNSFRIPSGEMRHFAGFLPEMANNSLHRVATLATVFRFSRSNTWETPATARLEIRNQEPIVSISAGDEAYINDIALSPDGQFAHGADVARERIVVFDLKAKKVVADIPGGREPFSLVLSEDGTRLYVANIGDLRLFDCASRDGRPVRPDKAPFWFSFARGSRRGLP